MNVQDMSMDELFQEILERADKTNGIEFVTDDHLESVMFACLRELNHRHGITRIEV